MDSDVADLGDYITKRYYGSSSSSSTDGTSIFQKGTSFRRPLLKKNRINRFIFFPGIFDPPHRGHEALLRHAFQGTQDINCIAAIILPLDDDRLKRKYASTPDRTLLSREERVQLWRGEENVNDLHEWSWVYDKTEEDWYSFRDNLIKDVAEDGFWLKCILLMGPEYLNCQDHPIWADYEKIDGIVVSDVARSADSIMSAEGTLRQLKSCEPWKNIITSDEEIKQRVKQDAKSLQLCMFQLAPKMLDTTLKSGKRLFLRSVHQPRLT